MTKDITQDIINKLLEEIKQLQKENKELSDELYGKSKKDKTKENNDSKNKKGS